MTPMQRFHCDRAGVCGDVVGAGVEVRLRLRFTMDLRSWWDVVHGLFLFWFFLGERGWVGGWLVIGRGVS